MSCFEGENVFLIKYITTITIVSAWCRTVVAIAALATTHLAQN